MNIAIVFAGGIGQRFGNDFDKLPKQFLKINNKPILVYTLEHFQNHEKVDKIYLSVLAQYLDYTKELIQEYNLSKVVKIVEGGSCAMESIFNALEVAYNENPKNSIVLIHDGVRPIINKDVIDENISSVQKYGTAVTAIPCNETIVVSQDKKTANKVPKRCETFKAQAPQSFILEEIYQAHRQIESYEDIVDNCTLFSQLGKKVNLVKGNFGNIKITTPEDVYILNGILEYLNSKEGKID